MRDRVHAIFLLLAALFAAPFLVSCGPSPTTLDRIAPPVRFSALREAAAWSPGFDPEWWSTIDRAYAEYDAALDGFVRDTVDPFVQEVARARLQGRLPSESRAREQRAAQERIVAELLERERKLVVALDDALPPEADRFIALLLARIEFRRAVAPLFEPGDTPPGPLEVLVLNGRAMPEPAVADAAIEAYTVLAAAAREAARAEAGRFVAYCGRKAEAIAAMKFEEQRIASQSAAGKAIDRNADPAYRAAAEGDRSVNRDFANTVERSREEFRLSLLREGARVGEAIADPARREDYLSRFDAYLHEGVRSIPSMRAAWQIGRRMIEREPEMRPDGTPGLAAGRRAELLEEFDEIYAYIVERDRALRPRLRSGSKEERREAYEELVGLVTPMREFLERHFSRFGDAADRVDLMTFRVTGGLATPDQAVAAMEEALANEAAAVEPEPVATLPGRDRGMELLLGAPLHEGVTRALLARLRVTGDSARGLATMLQSERTALAERTAGAQQEIRGDLRAIERSGGTNDVDRVVGRLMASIRARTDRVHGLDRAANEAMLGEIARAAGVAPDDERVAIARIELELLSEIGGDRGSNEAERIGGLTPPALVNPFEVVRSMGADESQRTMAESVVFARADELRAAHAEARRGFERNIRGLLRSLIAMQSAGDPAAVEPWKPEPAGDASARLRVAIGEELRRVLGDAVAHAYLTRLRELAAPTMEPLRDAAFHRLDRFAAGAGLKPDVRAATADIREVVAEFLDAADERRFVAANAALEWRAGWVTFADLDTRDDWRRLSGFSPLGWLHWSRISDADERAMAACSRALAGIADCRDAAIDAADLPLILPRQLEPSFDSAAGDGW